MEYSKIDLTNEQYIALKDCTDKSLELFIIKPNFE